MKAGAYVHVPLCKSKCGYCAFYSVAVAGADVAERYVTAIEREWGRRIQELGGANISTIYIGGGTPSSLPAPLLRRLVRFLRENAGADVEEFTIEVNPDDVTPELADMLKAEGVTRVSMGVQSLDSAELTTARRRHDAAGAIAAYTTLRRAGFNNISLDMIMGLPGQTLASFESSLGRMLDLRPEHLSVYMLQWEAGTAFTRAMRRHELEQLPDSFFADAYSLLCEKMRAAGYHHYEISNFALPGCEARHNAAYWTCRTPYLGLGPTAHSLTTKGRSHNSRGLTSWRNIPDTETPLEQLNDLIFTALRTSKGLSLVDVEARFGTAAKSAVMADARPLLADGSLILKDINTLLIPEPRWLLADTLSASLMQLPDD